MSQMQINPSHLPYYAQAADVLAECNARRDDLDSLMNPGTGFAWTLSRVCKNRLRELSDPESDVEATPEDLELLRLESNTWDLVQSLISVRKTEPPKWPSPRALLRKNPYTPIATLAQAILKHSPILNELVIVREWLHDSAPAPHPPGAAAGYWRGTRLRLQQAQVSGEKKDVESLVSSLDPDVLNREDGKVLDSDDASYEKALAQALYTYIRAGKIEDAIKLCREAKRPWRAATIRGSLLFDWKALAGETPKEGQGNANANANTNGNENANEKTGSAPSWTGNKRRKLWRQTCTRAALGPSLSEPDRLFHAALVPLPETSVILKSACRTWHDHVWVQVSVICEARTVGSLSRIGGGYWEGGLEAVERIAAEEELAASLSSPEQEEQDRREEAREEEEWERESVEALETLASVAVTEGPPASDPFHTAQLHIILNRSEKLLVDFAHGLEIGEFNQEQPNFPFLMRFMVHLCLFYRMVDMPVPAEATKTILEKYLEVLQETGQTNLIALYASALGDNAVERYALFLVGLELSADITERRQALKRAEDHGLDKIRVAQVTAEMSVDKALEALPRMKVSLPAVVEKHALSDMEWYFIRSIEWTTFYEETYPNALLQANVIIRQFLGCGQIEGARTLLRNVPPALRNLPIDDAKTRDQMTEFLHYLQFFTIWELFDRVVEAHVAEKALTTKGAEDAWLTSYTKLLNEIRKKIVELLTTEWLVNEDEIARIQTHDARLLLMVRIRRIYIPELVMRLHTLLVDSGDRIPRNLKYAFELANIVADSRYRLYEDFISDGMQRLEDYLRAVRQAILRGLENGGSDPFRVLRMS